MRTIRELQADSVRGVVFDVDDTVTHRGVLEPEAFSAMHALAEAGLRLVAVTGRPLGWTDVLARLWPVDLAVGENGAGWARCSEEGFSEGYFHDAPERLRQARLLERIRLDVQLRMPEVELADDQRARRCDLAFDVGEQARLSDPEVSALVEIIEQHGARSAVSTVHAHAIPGEWNKAAGIVRALDQELGIQLQQERERWVFVGDSGNDAEAFAYFPVSVGVANVRSQLHRLPSPPSFVTEAERGRGFAELARHLLDKRD